MTKDFFTFIRDSLQEAYDINPDTCVNTITEIYRTSRGEDQNGCLAAIALSLARCADMLEEIAFHTRPGSYDEYY